MSSLCRSTLPVSSVHFPFGYSELGRESRFLLCTCHVFHNGYEFNSLFLAFFPSLHMCSPSAPLIPIFISSHSSSLVLASNSRSFRIFSLCLCLQVHHPIATPIFDIGLDLFAPLTFFLYLFLCAILTNIRFGVYGYGVWSCFIGILLLLVHISC